MNTFLESLRSNSKEKILVKTKSLPKNVKYNSNGLNNNSQFNNFIKPKQDYQVPYIINKQNEEKKFMKRYYTAVSKVKRDSKTLNWFTLNDHALEMFKHNKLQEIIVTKNRIELEARNKNIYDKDENIENNIWNKKVFRIFI
jgi:hypothetical protein